ncbi:hypothetical protein FNF27_04374 [Cafeteria roenbergensis]|uniref:Uncharacterized protein n=2 Tax=Cafeteria roenbergensis TaxID=33653 RepID=A0A5A8E8L8_CAFRO|nr:hypothetical protein FNF27_04374 [Cafeteria roenbergensis]
MSLLAAAEGHVNLNVITVNVERAGRERLQDAVAHVNELCERPSVHLELDWVYEGNHVPEKNAMYGYDATDAMLSRILKETRNQRDAGGWLLVTNGDNLYSAAFFEAVKQHMNGPAAVIATRFLTRYPMPTEFGQVANVPLSPAPHMNEIDLGCYVSRMSRIRELGVNFVNNTANIRGADGLFAEKLKPDGEKFVMIPRILFYHQ